MTTTARPKLPEFHFGTDTHNLPDNKCRIDWAVLIALKFIIGPGQSQERSKVVDFAKANGINAGLENLSDEWREEADKATTAYELLMGAAGVARDERKDLEACSRLASHAIVALNWMPKITDETDGDADFETIKKMLRVAASGKGDHEKAVNKLIDWLCDHFATKKPRKITKGFGIA